MRTGAPRRSSTRGIRTRSTPEASVASARVASTGTRHADGPGETAESTLGQVKPRRVLRGAPRRRFLARHDEHALFDQRLHRVRGYAGQVDHDDNGVVELVEIERRDALARGRRVAAIELVEHATDRRRETGRVRKHAALHVSYGILLGMANADDTSSHAPIAHPDRAIALESRFLFVDVAAQRAKQLRRGALPRLPGLPLPPPGAPRPDYGHKLERLAMDEVRQGFIDFTLPPTPVPRAGAK